MKYFLIFFLLLSCNIRTDAEKVIADRTHISSAFILEHGENYLETRKKCSGCHKRHSACDICHVEIPHSEDFLEGDHAEIAKTYKGGCLNCHKKEICLECHDGNIDIGWEQ